MLSVPGNADNVRIIFFNDDQTPCDFVIDLLRSVFRHSNADAEAFAAKGDRRGKAAFGSYPADMADGCFRLLGSRSRKAAIRSL